MSARPVVDEVDIKILKTLMKDPRTSFAKIAKSCQLSTNTIRTRFARLKKIGVITGSILQINPNSLGYNYNGVIHIQTDYNEGEDFFEFLGKIPGLVVSFRQLGKFNIWSFFALRSYTQLDEVIQHIKLHPHVLKINLSLLVDVKNVDHPEKFEIEPEISSVPTKITIKDPKNEETISPKNTTAEVNKEIEPKSATEFDDIDISIMYLLSKNARMSFRKIATKIGISTQAVIKRHNKIRKTNPFSSLTVNLEKLGYIGNVFFQIMVSNQRVVSEVFGEVLRVKNVIIAFRTMGTFQILAGLPFKSIDELLESHHNLTRISGVIEAELYITKPIASWPVNIYSELVSKRCEQLK